MKSYLLSMLYLSIFIGVLALGFLPCIFYHKFSWYLHLDAGEMFGLSIFWAVFVFGFIIISFVHAIQSNEDVGKYNNLKRRGD